MSQRDCGCPGLVTPTLDELLAVARNKPLPRVRIRERRPPPVKVGASLKGWMEWRLVNRQGREVAGGEGPNLILDQGLDLIATTVLKRLSTASSEEFPIIHYAAVGTDSTTPDPSQTGLGAEVARTSTTFATDAISRPSDGVYRLTKSFEFGYTEANGNLTEWGCSPVGSVGSNLFNRALFTDSNGDPDPVTKTDQEKLRIIYTLEIALSPVSLTPGSFDIAGVGTITGNYMLIGWDSPDSLSGFTRQPDLQVFSALARADMRTTISNLPQLGSAAAWDSDMSGVTYTQQLSVGADTGTPRVARDTTDARDAYTPGSFERTGGSWRWDTAYGNLDPIRAFTIAGNGTASDSGRAGYVFDLDNASEFSKDNEHALVVGMPTVTWGRS